MAQLPVWAPLQTADHVLQSRPMCSVDAGTAASHTGAPSGARAARQRSCKSRLLARAVVHYAAASLRRNRASGRSMHHKHAVVAKKRASLVARPSVHACCAPNETAFSFLPNDLRLLALREAYSATQNSFLMRRRLGTFIIRRGPNSVVTVVTIVIQALPGSRHVAGLYFVVSE